MKQRAIWLPMLIFFCTEGPAQTGPSRVWTGVQGAVTASKTGAPLPARIVITDESGKAFNSFYNKLDGFFTEEDGRFSAELAPGKYRMQVYRGIDYLSSDTTIEISAGKTTTANVELAVWYPLKEKGWVNGDGHDHLYTEMREDTAMLDTVRRVCLAQGIDFMCAAQGWAGFDDTSWRRGYSLYSDEKFMLHYGSEMPKYRTGHTWWLGQTTTKGIYWQTMDTTYENHYYQSDQGITWNFNTLRFPQIPDIEVVQRFRALDNSIAVVAHPTSWWWQKRGDIEKYVTNVAAYLPFGLLAGKIWEAQVIMGYDCDHYYYQNLWFNVLNQGYRVTPVSELDGGYNRGDKFYYGSMRTYYKVDGALSLKKIIDAVRKGRTFVTSGPIIMADIDKRFSYGDVIKADGKARTLHLEAFASGDKDDRLSYVVMFRNGNIFRLWDLRKQELRQFSTTVPIIEKDNSWYVIKAYGKKAWSDTALLDVMKYCRKDRHSYDFIGTESDVAITSPFYFRKTNIQEPETLRSNITMRLRAGGKEISRPVDVEVLVNGKRVQRIKLPRGNGRIVMPVHGILRISTQGYQPVYRTLYLDYEPYRNLVEKLASGKWLDDFKPLTFQPGEVPWAAFGFDEAKKVLSDVSWDIDLLPNERDSLWPPFLNKFERAKQ